MNPVRSKRSRSLSLGFPTKGPPHTRLAGFWPSSTSRPYTFRPRTSTYSGLRTAGIYRISCEYGTVYVGQTGRTIEARLKEHRRHVLLNQPERSAVAEHSLTTYHRIDFHDASKLKTATRYMDRLVREAIEIRLYPDNFNRDDGFNLSYAWRPIIKMLQLPNSAPMANQEQAQVENQPHPPGHRRGLCKLPRRTLPYIRPWWWWWWWWWWPRWSSKRRYNTYT
jgi:hypothetical protein